MRHRKAGVKLNRSSSHRKAMFRNMVTSLFKHDRIKTTDARAKEVSRWADHIISLAKRGDLHARRQALSIVREKDVVHKLFEEAKARFGQRNGGYTRIVKLGRRPGDAALISMIELIASDDQVKKKKKKKPAAKPAAPAKEAATDAAEASPEDDAQDAADETQEASSETAETDAADAEDTEAAQEAAAPEAAADEAAEPEADAEDTTDAAPSDEAEEDEKKSE